MRVTSGKVVAGRVEIEGEPLPEGSVVTVLAREANETFELDDADENDLLASIAEADRGALIAAADVLRSLREQR